MTIRQPQSDSPSGDEPPGTQSVIYRNVWINRLLAACCVLGLFWYFHATDWDLLELSRCLLGLAALWLPCAALVYMIVRRQIDDFASRITFSLIASYALTTVHYVLWATLGWWLRLPSVDALFCVANVGVLGAACWVGRSSGIRWKALRPAALFKATDWSLLLLLVLSVGVTTRYKLAFEPPTAAGEHHYVADGDQTYYSALACELGRQTPPSQMAIRAGLRERAYHNFPHITTMLVSRFTGQADMLRAHMVYEYTAIEVLLSLAAFCIARGVTGSRWAGYASVALLYALAVPTQPLMDNSIGFFYCTLFPHATSVLEPTVITSPQMYSGVLVGYGVFVAVTAISLRLYRGQPAGKVAIIAALLVGAMARFRLQMFLVLLPAYFLILLAAWWRSGRRSYLLAGAASLALFAALYLEMRLPAYLPQTSHLQFRNNLLTFSPMSSWMQTWPGADWMLAALIGLFGDSVPQSWTWQIFCVLAFSVLNIIGLPSMLLALRYFFGRSARREWLLLTLLLASMFVFSIVGATCLSANYDSYSVGGQMPLHLGWYLFPVLAIGLWQLWDSCEARVFVSKTVWVALFVLIVCAGAATQLVRPPSSLEARGRAQGLTFSSDQWAAFRYVREHLPEDSVIMTTRYAKDSDDRRLAVAPFSGLGQRRAYWEYSATHVWAMPEIKADSEERLRRITLLWATPSRHIAEAELAQTPVTHLIEYSDQPLHVQDRSFLQREWVSEHGEVTIWRVLR